MNNEDYKEIAKIIAKPRKLINVMKNCVVKDLADYFEKEDKDKIIDKHKAEPYFNKEQFLKECGVK